MKRLNLPTRRRRHTLAKRKAAKKGWVKPEGMSKKMAEEVLAGKICGAKRCNTPGTQDKHFCRKPPTLHARETFSQPPYRCKFHGGAKGARKNFEKGHDKSMRHGIYSDAILPGEEKFYASLKVGNVDEEIRMCKLRLRRAMIMEARQRALIEKGKEGDQEIKDSMHLKESSKKIFVEKDGDGKKPKKSKAETTEVRANVNYSRAIKDISNELYKFEQIRAMQLQAGSGESDHDRAKRVQEEIKKIRASIEVVEAAAIEGDGTVEPTKPTKASAAEPKKIGPFEKGGGDGGGI